MTYNPHMYDLIDGLPSQLVDARKLCQSLSFSPKKAPIHRIVCVGMGGSGIASSLLVDCLGDVITVPLLICQDYALPTWINAYTLVIAVSYSGNTEETLEAMTQAHQAGCHIVGISSGGRMQTMLTDRGHDHIRVPGGLPPRTAIGYGFVCQIAVLQALGCLFESAGVIDAIATHLISSKTTIIEQAQHVAHHLAHHIPVLYTPSTMVSLGVRARQQLNENAKMLCRHHHYPECNHNEMLGWTGGDDRFRVLFVVPPILHPQNVKRLDLMQSWIEQHNARVYRLDLKGDHHFLQIWYGVWLMDWVSLFCADSRGVDAMDIRCIEDFKRKLGEKVG